MIFLDNCSIVEKKLLYPHKLKSTLEGFFFWLNSI